MPYYLISTLAEKPEQALANHFCRQKNVRPLFHHLFHPKHIHLPVQPNQNSSNPMVCNPIPQA